MARAAVLRDAQPVLWRALRSAVSLDGWSMKIGRRRARASFGFGVVAALIAGLSVAATFGQAGAPEMSRPGFDFWAPDWMMRELWGPGRMSKSMMVRLLRHTTYMSYGVPKDYENASSTVAPGPETTIAGAQRYQRHCSSCHGRNGLGDGEAGRSLTPSPALLAFMIRRPISVDEYLLWAISDGGKQFDSEMPAFKDTLSRDEIWQIVAYMRAGFPELEPSAKGKP